MPTTPTYDRAARLRSDALRKLYLSKHPEIDSLETLMTVIQIRCVELQLLKKDVAKLMGRTDSFVRRLLTDETHDPRTSTLIELLDALDLDVRIVPRSSGLESRRTMIGRLRS
jgi:hypothetical protein